MKRRRITVFLLLGVSMLSVAAGCAKNPAEDTAREQDISGRWLDYDAYRDRFLENRVPVSDYRDRYENEAEHVRNTDYKNLSFASTDFIAFPDCEEVSLLRQEKIVISPQESWDMIERWLEEIGKRDLVDMEREVRVNTPKVEGDESQEYPYYYPALSEHMDLEDASGVLVDTEDCYYSVLFAWSDGKITDYLQKPAKMAIRDINEIYTEDIVVSGSLEELGDQSYPLISGEMTIQEGADMIIDYLENGTVTEPAEGVSLEVDRVKVFRLGDVYGYKYNVHRVYKGIPAPRVERSGFQLSGCPYLPVDEDKTICVVDDTGVSVVVGYCDCMPLTEIYTDNSILGVEDAAEMLSEKLAVGLRMEVEEVSLVYSAYAAEIEDTETMLLPAWKFEGMNQTKGEKLVAYVDVLTGDLYYYTIPPEDIME